MYLTSREAMELLCIKSQNQLYRLVDAGKIPAYKPAGRLLFNRSALMGYIEDSQVHPKVTTTQPAPQKKKRLRRPAVKYHPGEKWVG